jgi:hypothetical protein
MNGGKCTDGIRNYTCDCTGVDFQGYNCTESEFIGIIGRF